MLYANQSQNQAVSIQFWSFMCVCLHISYPDTHRNDHQLLTVRNYLLTTYYWNKFLSTYVYHQQSLSLIVLNLVAKTSFWSNSKNQLSLVHFHEMPSSSYGKGILKFLWSTRNQDQILFKNVPFNVRCNHDSTKWVLN